MKHSSLLLSQGLLDWMANDPSQMHTEVIRQCYRQHEVLISLVSYATNHHLNSEYCPLQFLYSPA